MSLTKYRSVAEMPPPGRADDASLAARIRASWRRAFLLAPPGFPRGVRRFRTIEAANEARERATVERMRALRASG